MFGINTKVLIGIQARSTSTRLPGKIFLPIGDRPMLQHVIDAANNAKSHILKYSSKKKLEIEVAVLCPEHDVAVKNAFKDKVIIFDGPEDDVLTRYSLAAIKTESDYIIRLTSDCPLIPPTIISKVINTVVLNSLDYLSNVDPRVRTSFDGEDCEGFSKRMLIWLQQNAENSSHREHVTTLAREKPPEWARAGHIVGYIDYSWFDESVDEIEDYKRVCENYDSVQKKLEMGRRLFGKHGVYRF